MNAAIVQSGTTMAKVLRNLRTIVLQPEGTGQLHV